MIMAEESWFRGASVLVVLLAHDVRAERLQLFLDMLVASIDLTDVADDALALCAQRGRDQSHARANVWAFQALAVQPAGTLHDAAVRVAQYNACTHADELV